MAEDDKEKWLEILTSIAAKISNRKHGLKFKPKMVEILKEKLRKMKKKCQINSKEQILRKNRD